MILTGRRRTLPCMIRDLSESFPDAFPDYDLCVVGSGPAGMTLVRELADSGLRVALLESGRRRPTAFGDRLRRVETSGLDIKEYSRERVLGGASSVWAGLSAPLDSEELEPRPWLGTPRGRAGWPIPRDELVGYWQVASARYRFARWSALQGEVFERLHAAGDRTLSWSVLEEKPFLAAAEAQHFGREWGGVCDDEGPDLWLDTSVLRLEVEPGTRRISHALVANHTGKRGRLRARAFVLATGGIENARLLLLSTDLCAAGLGNERDQVGRGFMNHPKDNHGIITLSEPVRELPAYFGALFEGYGGYLGLRLNGARQRELELLNSYVRFEPLFPWSDRPGVEAFVMFAKRSVSLLSGWKKRRADQVVTLRDYSETGDDSDLQNARKTWRDKLVIPLMILRDAWPVLRYLRARLSRQAPLVKKVRLRNFMEMEPSPENRVTLGAGLDHFGSALPHVHSGVSALDRRSLDAVHEVLAEELRAQGFGELQSALDTTTPWPVGLDASHHLGTTCMGADPEHSVVDSQLKLHGVDNVYCAGGSVFPTSGCANPTYTIVALSLRLAERLADELGAARPPAFRAELDAAGSALGEAADARLPDPAIVPPKRAPAPGAAPRPVIVIGAGKRILQDVLPALLSLPDDYALRGVFAKHARTELLGEHAIEVRALDALSAEDLADAPLIYCCVSKTVVPRVLATLLERGAASCELLIDTPVLLFKQLGKLHLLHAFARVSVAEDCSTLPWIPLVHRALDAGLIGEPGELRLEHSAWRYHAWAMASTLLRAGRPRHARRRGQVEDGSVELSYAGGRRAVIVEPRDYANGRLLWRGSEGAIASGRELPADAHELAFSREGDRATGFVLGDLSEPLLPEESALLGPLMPDDTPTARTHDLKRVGLRRLLAGLSRGGGYPLPHGLEDAAGDFLLEKFGRWRPTPLTSPAGPVGRRLLGLVLRPLSRG